MKRLIIIACLIAGSVFGAYPNWHFKDSTYPYWRIESGYWKFQTGSTPPTPTSALILQYLMGANGSESTLTENTAPTGTNYNGTVVNASWIDATNGITSHYDLDGTSDYIQTSTNVSEAAGLSEGTWSFWVNNDAEVGGAGYITKRIGLNNREYVMWNAAGGLTMRLYSSNTDYIGRKANGYTAPNNKWTHIVCTYTGGVASSSIDIYSDCNVIDDTEDNGGSFSGMTDQASPINIGSIYEDSSEINGQIWGVEILTNALTASEVLATNRTQAVQLGIYPSYLTASQSSNVVFAMNHSGNTAQDTSTNSATVTAISTPTDYPMGLYNYAKYYTGVSGYSIGDVSQLDFDRTDAFSAGAWINANVGGGGVDTIIGKMISTAGRGWQLDLNAGLLEVRMANTLSSNDLLVQGNTDLRDGNWHQVWVTSSGNSLASGITFYVDGVPETPTVVRDGLSATMVGSGVASVASQNASVNYFVGKIDEPMTFISELTASEIGSLYTNSWTLFGQEQYILDADWFPESVLVQTYNLDAGSRDFSGNENNGTDTDMSYTGGDKSRAVFNGSTGSIQIGDDNTLDLETNTAFTISAWINPDILTSGIIMSKLVASTEQGYEFTMYDGGSYNGLGLYLVSHFSSASRMFVKSADILTANVWQHAVVTYSGNSQASGVTFYLDGVAQSKSITYDTLTGSIVNTGVLYIGSRRGATDFDGEMDNVQIISGTEMSSNQVDTLFKSQWQNVGQLPNVWTNSWFDNVQGLYTFNASSSQDYSTKGNHGTDTDVTYDGKTATFNGSSSQIDCGNNDAFTFGNGTTDSPFTITAWVKREGIGGDDFICGIFDAFQSEYLFWFTSDDELKVQLCSDGGTTDRIFFTSDSTVADTSWHHVAFVYEGDKTNGTFYLDGQEFANTRTTGGSYVAMKNTTGHFRWGVADAVSSYFDGSIDNPIVLNTALTQPEIQELYETYKPWDN